MSKRPVVFVLFVGLAAAGTTWWWRNREQAGQPTSLTLYGNIDIRTVQLAFDGEGLVTAVHVEEGARVKPGDVLATLDSSRLEAERDAAKAQVAAQEAVVRRLEAGARAQEIEQFRARVASAEARLANAEQTLKRFTQTTASGASSQQKLDDAQAQYNVEQAAVNEAKQALSLALEGPRQEDIEEAKARLEASRAQVRLLDNRIADTTLHTPTAGVIQSRLLEPGDYATRGRTVYTLAITDPKWVRAYVPEPDLGRVRIGAAAWVTADSFPGRRFPGWVGYVSSVAEFTPKAVETTDLRTQLVYEVRIYLTDPEDRLHLGMPTTVTIDENLPANAAPPVPGSLKP